MYKMVMDAWMATMSIGTPSINYIPPETARLNIFIFMLANFNFLYEATFGISNLKLIQRGRGWMSRRRPVSLLPIGGGLALAEAGMIHT